MESVHKDFSDVLKRMSEKFFYSLFACWQEKDIGGVGESNFSVVLVFAEMKWFLFEYTSVGEPNMVHPR
jgi:hypothetical protein